MAMSSKSNNIEPCPFCGEEAQTKYFMSRGRWYVVCGSCHARTTHFLDRNDAIKAWNRRAYGKENNQGLSS